MKRLCLTITLVLICIVLGITEIVTINYSSDICLNSIDKIEYEIQNKNYNKAAEICKRTNDKYEKITSKIIFCYYSHTNLENINNNLSVMTELLKNHDIKQYVIFKEKTKKQLQAIKEEELFNLQNIF
jgi:LPS O-antigen subunit length determinant protein (WzzB/FepE family)